jgi:DNA-binding HxlR family transcriptional regulator
MNQQKTEEIEFDQPCPIRDVLDRIGDQWSLLVLEALGRKTMRFNELGREIDDISRQMLARTLRRLEEDGYLSRTIFAEVPPRVEYTLTSLGRSFLDPLRILTQWADENHGAICKSRKLARLAQSG